MNLISLFASAVLFLGMAAPAFALSIDPDKMSHEKHVELGGVTLQLNGQGVRHRGENKVYLAALYTLKKGGTPEEILSMPGPKRFAILLLRDIDAAEMGKLFSRGMEDNMEKSKFSRLVPGVMGVSQWFTVCKKLLTGQMVTIDWAPGTGTVMNVSCNRNSAPLKEPEFYDALLRIWLGPNPADAKLKEALLGKPS